MVRDFCDSTVTRHRAHRPARRFPKLLRRVNHFQLSPATESTRERQVRPLTAAIITDNHAINPECL